MIWNYKDEFVKKQFDDLRFDDDVVILCDSREDLLNDMYFIL